MFLINTEQWHWGQNGKLSFLIGHGPPFERRQIKSFPLVLKLYLNNSFLVKLAIKNKTSEQEQTTFLCSCKHTKTKINGTGEASLLLSQNSYTQFSQLVHKYSVSEHIKLDINQQ